MNRRMVFYTIGQILLAEAIMLILPMIVALYYHESGWREFLITAAISAVSGGLLMLLKPKNRLIYAREGFAIVALAWVVMSIIGSVPFYISGEIPHYADALFETVSGFSTTGASILSNIEGLSNCMLFWRSFTHWVGGMGVLVFVLTIVPLAGSRAIHLMRAELTGPIVDKIVPKMKDSAKILYGIYIVLTLLEIFFLAMGGMPIFDSINHALSTAATGGFSIKNLSVSAYDSAYFDTVITIFMLLFGINFNMFYLLLVGNFKSILKNEELRTYIGIVIAAIAMITVNILSLYDSAAEALRYASFQVVAIITTSGFMTADYELWPDLSRIILLLLMIVGGCAGSTAGGFKIARILLLVRVMRREIQKLLHPRLVSTVKLGGKVVSQDAISGTFAYLAIYIGIFLISLFLLSFEGHGFEVTFTAALSSLNNIGPGFGLIGPTGNFAFFSDFSKVILMINMLFGRLEIFPILLTFAPSTWRKRA